MFFDNTDTQRMLLEQELRMRRAGIVPEDIPPSRAELAWARFAKRSGEVLGAVAAGAVQGWRDGGKEHYIPANIEEYDFSSPYKPKIHETWHPFYGCYDDVWGD